MLGFDSLSSASMRHVIAKDVKSSTYCCYVKWLTFIVRLGLMHWPQTGVTHYHAQLGLPDKVLAINGLVVCYVVWLGSIIYGMGLLTSARCVVRMAMELKYRNNPHIHKDTNACQYYSSHKVDVHISILDFSLDFFSWFKSNSTRIGFRPLTAPSPYRKTLPKSSLLP